jgi:hypothetical protein
VLLFVTGFDQFYINCMITLYRRLVHKVGGGLGPSGCTSSSPTDSFNRHLSHEFQFAHPNVCLHEFQLSAPPIKKISPWKTIENGISHERGECITIAAINMAKCESPTFLSKWSTFTLLFLDTFGQNWTTFIVRTSYELISYELISYELILI